VEKEFAKHKDKPYEEHFLEIIRALVDTYDEYVFF